MAVNDIDQVKIAIVGIIFLEVSMGILSFLSKGTLDIGIIGMGITAIAGLAGYDMKPK